MVSVPLHSTPGTPGIAPYDFGGPGMTPLTMLRKAGAEAAQKNRCNKKKEDKT